MRVAERVRSWAKRFSFKDNPLADVAEEEPMQPGVTPQLQHGAPITYTKNSLPISSLHFVSAKQPAPERSRLFSSI